MKILFCGGGTAGHISPAIAMAEMLSDSRYRCECAFVGRSGGEENLTIVNEGYKLYTIEIEGIARKLSGGAIKSCIKAIRSLKEAEAIIDEFKPDLIIGTGGYVCWPVIKVGIKKKIKTAIHESNAEPGLATRLLAPRCDAVLINLKVIGYLSCTRNLNAVYINVCFNFFRARRIIHRVNVRECI